MQTLIIKTKKQERQILIAKILFASVMFLLVFIATFISVYSFFGVRTKMMNPQINFVIGDCQYKENEESPWLNADIAVPIKEDYIFRTGTASMIDLILQDRTAIRVTENSVFKLDDLNSVDVSVNLISGTVFAKIKKRMKFQNIIVKTPTTTAAVRGTEFTISVKNADHISKCIEGSVEVKISQSEDMLVEKYKKLDSKANIIDMTNEEKTDLKKIMKSISLDRRLFNAQNIVFSSGSYELDEKMEIELNLIYGKIKNKKGIISIIGHTDNLGDSEAANVELSKQRANSIKKYFVKKGFKENRIKTIGLGSSQPLFDNNTSEGQNSNRRVEFIITNK